MELYSEINRANLHILMTIFYKDALEDPMLGVYFIDELGEDLEEEEWIEHIDLLADFWLAKICGEETYGGNFIGTHARIPHIRPVVFDRWLELFSETAVKVYTPQVAAMFQKRATQLTKQFLNTKLEL